MYDLTELSLGSTEIGAALLLLFFLALFAEAPSTVFKVFCAGCNLIVGGGKARDDKVKVSPERRRSVPHTWAETSQDQNPESELCCTREGVCSTESQRRPPPATIHTPQDVLLEQLYQSAPGGGVIVVEGHPLIFSGEYTKAMDQDWHSGHFCCWNCDLSLTGHRYILRDEHPFCIKCYESLFANHCEDCKQPIGTDSKDLSYKDKHWHERCFICCDCKKSLVDQPFASKDEKLYCADCHDNNFAPRCDACGNIFKAGMKKFEFRGKQWHEECFICFACRQPIGNKRFIPRDHEFVCVPCYEEQFAQRCAKCNGVINKGGITYKGVPYHRDCFVCANCPKILAGEKFTSREDRPYCADCFGELFAKKCCRCSKPITGLGGTKFISFDDRHWHSDCFCCYKCSVSLVGRGFLTCGDDVVCPECGKLM